MILHPTTRLLDCSLQRLSLSSKPDVRVCEGAWRGLLAGVFPLTVRARRRSLNNEQGRPPWAVLGPYARGRIVTLTRTNVNMLNRGLPTRMVCLKYDI